MRIAINDTDIATFGLTPIKGTLDNLCKPVEMKSLVTNENSAIDGVIPVLYDRHIKSRSVSMLFIIRQPSLADLLRVLDQLIAFLQNGAKDSAGAYTHINEVYIEEQQRKYRLIYESFDKYANFDTDGKATISIKFTEPNPMNRAV
jgi:hypothetical protein